MTEAKRLHLSAFSKRSHILGEGPRWVDGMLWWIDIDAGELWRADESNEARCVLKLPYQIGCIAPTVAGGFILATREGFELFDPSENHLRRIADPQPTRMTRFNDGRVDPAGRLWAGTMAIDSSRFGEPLGSLYCMYPDGTIVEKIAGLTISNGIDWSNDGKTMYLNDTMRGITLAFDYDVNDGKISNRRTFSTLDVQQGFPDGLLVDADDHIWIAVIGAGKLIRFRPDASIDTVISVGTTWPTALTFGGNDLSTLYITTSRHLMNPSRAEERAGWLLKTPTKWRGRPENRFRGLLC